MYLLSKLVWIFLKPFNIFLFSLMAGATLTAWGRGRVRRLGQWLVGLALAILIGLNLLPIGNWAVAALETRFPPPGALPARIDGVIVLGGMFEAALTRTHGTISLNSAADRLWAGLELARIYPEARLVFSGGNGLPLTDVPGEAELAKRAFLAAGLTGPRLTFEHKSRNTYENAVFSHQLVHPQPGEIWLLVTSAFHMPRAVGSFRAAGWPVTPYPVDHTTGGTLDPIANFSMMRQFGFLNRAMHEWLGLTYYFVNGWTKTLFPAPDQSAG